MTLCPVSINIRMRGQFYPSSFILETKVCRTVQPGAQHLLYLNQRKEGPIKDLDMPQIISNLFLPKENPFTYIYLSSIVGYLSCSVHRKQIVIINVSLFSFFFCYIYTQIFYKIIKLTTLNGCE
ncbi:unnamed protein product [Lymnaea stagnalis]|uniref:Uncharacterized protein n=1 Tax=Lymnaea stagnalis TaxID=6523 RepID=A0AAV2IEC2_LYMST